MQLLILRLLKVSIIFQYHVLKTIRYLHLTQKLQMCCMYVFSDLFLYQHCVQVIKKNKKNNLFCVLKTFFCWYQKDTEYSFYTSIVSTFKILLL